MQDNSNIYIIGVIAFSLVKVFIIKLLSVDFPLTRPYTTFLFLWELVL